VDALNVGKKLKKSMRVKRWGYALPQSTYLSFALMTGVDSVKPITWMGKLINVGLGFFMVVIVAAYTANLAAFLAAPGKMVEPIADVEDLININKPACTRSLMVGMIQPVYLGLTYKLANREFNYISAVTNAECEAAISGMSTVNVWLSRPESCGIKITGRALVQKTNGWIADKRQVCVHHALGYAIEHLKTEGTINSLYKKWIVKANCNVQDAGSASDVEPLGISELGGLLAVMCLSMGVAFLVDLWKRCFGTLLFSSKVVHGLSGDRVRLDNKRRGEDDNEKKHIHGNKVQMEMVQSEISRMNLTQSQILKQMQAMVQQIHAHGELLQRGTQSPEVAPVSESYFPTMGSMYPFRPPGRSELTWDCPGGPESFFQTR
jgi:hypothetical protein